MSLQVHIHRIPGLSEHFLYFNDDLLVGRALNRSVFFDASGPLLTPGLLDKDATHFGLASHIPVAMSVSCIAKDWQQNEQLYTDVSGSHCRHYVEHKSPRNRFLKACSREGPRTTMNYVSCDSASGAPPCIQSNSSAENIAQRLTEGLPDFITIK